MGVLENRRNVYFNDTVNINQGQESSGEDTGSDGGEDVPVLQIPTNGGGQQDTHNRRRNQQQTPPSPASGRKYQRCGHKLVLKKGRRSRQRCESERSLAVEVFGSADIPEEALEGWDIVNPSRSHFTALLTEAENANLLKEFIEGATVDQDPDGYERLPRGNRVLHHPEDPEEAFLSISTALRGALKKHYNEGALVALEEEIMAFFQDNPCQDYVADHLDGYERLLAHAASKYHQLQSRSFDEDGKRKIKIGNPLRTEFQPIDPSLSKYLKIRAMRNKQRGL